MDVLLEHYHRFFHGRATDTIELEFDGVELTLLAFVYPYFPGRRVLASFGLSLMPARVECIHVFPEGVPDVIKTFGATLLFALRNSCMKRDALIRFGVEAPFVASTGKSAAFLTVPYSVPELEEFHFVTGTNIRVLEAFVVTDAEADYVEANGVDAFEKIASDTGADLTDFGRPSLI